MLTIAVSVLASLVIIWIVFVVALLVAKPDSITLREAARIIPDTVRLVRRLAADKTLHRGVRIRLWLLLAYLVSPIDIVPDFVPVVGFADDALVTSIVLRSVIRRAGAEAVTSHWPGTPDGLATLFRVCRLPPIDS
jgi:uncharacterized membrane protein YkvA (DUF1232 family)